MYWTVLCVLMVSIFAQSQHGKAESPDYAHPFGSNPFFPSQLKTEDGNFISADDFPTAKYCAKCHQEAHQQWRRSAHANSFRAPFYKKNVDFLIKQKGIEYTRHCEGCHNPIALVSGALTTGSKIERKNMDEDGLTCSVCHSITKVQGTSGTGSYMLSKPAVMVRRDGQPRIGKVSDAEILAHPELHRKAVMRDFYRTPEYCAVCHKAAIPKELNDYKWLRAFSVYDEWQQSSWSGETPLPFYKKPKVTTCQNCHMPATPAKADYGAKNGQLASHRWPGANTAIPSFYGFDEQLVAIQEFLKNKVSIDIFAIEKESDKDHETETKLIAPLGASSYSIQLGEKITVHLVIQNKQIGHSLVPEQRDFYECWDEFNVTDRDGRVIYKSGYLDANGFLEKHAHTYTNRLVSKEGELLFLHQVWNTQVKTYDNTILPGRSDLVRYRFRIPDDARGPITISAKVNYRRFNRGYTNYILDQKADYPIAQLATNSLTLNVGENAGTPPSDKEAKQAELLRWNNYGIALLGQQQWWRAAEAFKRVIEINPDNVDGYINLALAQYSTLVNTQRETPDGPGRFSVDNANARPEEFQPALVTLEKALKVSAGNDRTLYYQGVIHRLQNRLDAAAQDQKAVIAHYPRFRQARQELGYVYFLQRKDEAAREQFEALQTINPDDLTAHYYLSTIYARLGMKEKADEQLALYGDRKEDPLVWVTARDFWRTHPEVAKEIVNYHVHEDADGK